MYYFKEASVHDERIAAFKLRYKIYCEEKGWFDKNDYSNNQEIDIFDSASDIFIAKDHENKIVGTARLIHHTESNNLQILKHPGIDKQIDLQKCAEISRLATSPLYRSGPIAMGLIRIVYNHILKNPTRYKYLYIVVEKRFFRVLNALGFSFVIQGQPAYFCGDVLVVAKMKVSEMDNLAFIKNPEFHQWLHQDSYSLEERATFTNFCKRRKLTYLTEKTVQADRLSA